MALPLICLALAASVQAADLHVEITAPGGQPVAIDYPDVQFGALPGLMVHGDNEGMLLVHISLSPVEVEPDPVPQVLFDVVMQELSSDKKGRAYLKVLSSPQIRARVNEQARFAQGSRIPIAGTDPVEYEDRILSIELLYTDPVLPDVEPAPEPAPEPAVQPEPTD